MGRVFLPKLGWMRYRQSRLVEGELRNITISESGGCGHMSIQTRREVPDPTPMVSAFCGIDMGIASLATLDSGEQIKGPSAFKKHETRRAKYRRRMSRKVKGSSNWKKARRRVQKVHAHIGTARKDFLHKQSTKLGNA